MAKMMEGALLVCCALLLGCGDLDGEPADDAGTDGIVGQAPGAPTELEAVGVKPTVSLSWQAASDDVGVVGYKIFRDGVEIADVTETSFVDTFDGEPPKTCQGNAYTVKAYDGDGNHSDPSAEARSTLAVKNVVFMIGDGMGPGQQKAAGCYLFGPDQGSPGSQLSFETLPVTGEVTNAPATGTLTDSAAAGTAMATGHKVNNQVISVALPGDGSDLYTILECFRDQGKATGIVTTTTISNATPAAFGAHATSRGKIGEIVNDMLNGSRPNVLFGGAHALVGITPDLATAAGYTVVTDRAELQALPAGTAYVSGQFISGYMPYEYDAAQATPDPYDTLPHLREMTQAALDLLGEDPDGLFLMVEGGRIDHAGHDNDIERNIFEAVEFDKAAKTVIDWASTRPDTLVIVTADHETGGLSVDACGAKGEIPTVSWSSDTHTSTNVRYYAKGPVATRLSGTIPNTAFFDAITDGSPTQ